MTKDQNIEESSALDVILARGRRGLALNPFDCAAELSVVADAMMAAAQGMSWVAQYGEDIEQSMRDELSAKAAEMDGASRLAHQWANAIVSGSPKKQHATEVTL